MTSKLAPFQRHLAIFILVLAIIAVYAGSLSAPFVFDDFTFFSAPATVAEYSHIHLNPRALSYATLSWTVG
ncbi:MAG: hypothetical protein HY938_06950, partial [Nitrosomonadales bacterium]|nr:hypothetical protein [Nitrosomonadales bacterium]